MDSLRFGNENAGNQIGINNGSVYLGPDTERPRSPRIPVSTVPFRRDPDFVDRGTLLDQLRDKDAPGARVALVGLGGVGKSQLAIEYCYRVRTHSPSRWVFWIHASNATRFEQSCRGIADLAKIPGRHNLQTNIFKLLHDWLQNTRNGSWVLVFDNLDDDEFLHEHLAVNSHWQASNQSSSAAQPIWSYFSQNPNGLILITSRNRLAVSCLTEDSDIITVNPMDELQAVSLFRKKLGDSPPSDLQDAVQLTTALDFMPLAIVQAASYIKQRAPRMTAAQYFENFTRNDQQKIRLLGYRGGHLRRDWEAESSILITWEISFHHICQMSPTAAEMLYIMSFYDRQEIPESLLRQNPEAQGTSSSEGLFWQRVHRTDEGSTDSPERPSVVDTFEDDLMILRDFSLVSITSDGSNFEIHRLVQLATQKWLDEDGQLERWKERSIHNLCVNFPPGRFENWKECQLLFAHVQCILTQRPSGSASLKEWASLLHQAASFAWTRGNFVDSRRMAEQAINARQNLFGMQNENTLDSLEILGLAFRLGGQWKMAEEIQTQIVDSRAKLLGSEHPDALTGINNLASVFRDQGRWTEALDLGVQVMKTRQNVLGLEHPDTLTSMNNLALTFRILGRWKEAEELWVRVIESRKEVLGLEHPSTLASMHNLAHTYRNQGRWNQAEKLGYQVGTIRKQVLGLEHPDTLTSLGNLASTYRDQGRWKEAEELGIQVVEIHKQVLWLEHPETLTSIGNLALTYRFQGRWKEAEELQMQVIQIRKRVLGPEHPDTLISMSNLASIFRGQGQFAKAENLGMQVLITRKRMLGPEHPSTLTSINNLASTFREQRKWREAEELGAQVMEARRRVLGQGHPDTLTTMANLALTYRGQGRCKEADELEIKVTEARKQTRMLGREISDTSKFT